jgi:hypothetical protein
LTSALDGGESLNLCSTVNIYKVFHVQFQHVVPLNEECGIVEWVPKLVAFRNVLTRLYKEAGIYTNNKQLRDFSSRE